MNETPKQTTERRRCYVVRVECPTQEDYDILFDAIANLVGELWDKPPVFLSGGMEEDCI